MNINSATRGSRACRYGGVPDVVTDPAVTHARGHAEPMYHTDRSDNYARQRGITPGIWPVLTPRQQRRYWQKLRRQVGGPREYYANAEAPDG